MLASTMQISNNKPTTSTAQTNPENPGGTHTTGREKKQDKPVPSGPNSAPTTHPHPHRPFQPTRRPTVLTTTRESMNRIVSVPPMSNRHETLVRETATGPPTQRWTATCSLERR